MNFAPNKQLNVDGKDPSWVSKKNKKLLKDKSKFIKQYIKNGTRIEISDQFLNTISNILWPYLG